MVEALSFELVVSTSNFGLGGQEFRKAAIVPQSRIVVVNFSH